MEREISYQWDMSNYLENRRSYIIYVFLYIIYVVFYFYAHQYKNHTSPSNSCAKDRKAKEALKAQKADI